MKLTHINWFYEDEMSDENDWYPLPTIMCAKHHYAGARMMICYIHFIWLRWVRNIELCFDEPLAPTPELTDQEGRER